MTTFDVKDNTLVIKFAGRIDSTNANSVEKIVNEALASAGYDNIIIDADDLEYISSAGLRIVLKIAKAKNTKIINVNTDVFEILEMTGFSEMIKVEKGYRKLSVEGCEVIGQGANGKVYRLDPDTIIKVYLNPDSLDDIRRERELARCAFIHGIPTAIPYDVVKVGEGYGSVFELLNSKSFAKLIAANPEDTEKYTKMSVNLLKIIHSTEVNPDDMPDMKKVVVGWVNFLKEFLPEDKWQKLNKLVQDVPENNHVIHGDYHIKNVMLQNGEALLIDMDTLAHGDPVFEFGSIFNAYLGFSRLDPSISLDFLGIEHHIAEKIWDTTIKLYFDTENEDDLTEITNKAALIGYVRLMRRLIRRNGFENEDDRKLINFYKEQIISLIDKIDKLTF